MLDSLSFGTRQRQRLKVGWLATVALILASCDLQGSLVAAFDSEDGLGCKDVTMMPDEILVTRSLDTVQNYTDVHIF